MEQLNQADVRCGAASGGLECIDQEAQTASDGAASCVGRLNEVGVTCPVPGAPTMGHAGLAALTALLAMLGIVVLRRRMSHH